VDRRGEAVRVEHCSNSFKRVYLRGSPPDDPTITRETSTNDAAVGGG
jgi:hypothetical protein